MKIKNMEVEEKIPPVVDNPEESSGKKGKILTLLFPAESHSAEGKDIKKDKNKPPTKIVIRRLPPKLTKEAFQEEFSPLPAHDYFHFVRGDLNLGIHSFSRAYINFLNQEDIFSFKEKYDDYDIQDEKGKIYHAVVEFAPSQKIPRRNTIKKKLSKAGTLESDPKYIEFLQKLEESKNFINNPSEYFHETESSALKAKIVTTPLLEYLKKKKQKKIDLKNEIRQRKREAEKEKRKREEEKRKAERERRKEEKKNLEKNRLGEEKGKKNELKDKKLDERGSPKDDKKDFKNLENSGHDPGTEETLDSVIPNDPAILEVVVRHSSTDKDLKSTSKNVSSSTEDTRTLKSYESDTNIGKPERKYSDFRTRLIEEKQRKTFYKRDIEDLKTFKTSYTSRKGVPDEKGDNYSIGSVTKDSVRKLPSDTDAKRHDYKVEMKETKSKFRYSEQRNRDREFRQKTSDFKSSKENPKPCVETKDKSKDSEEKTALKVSNLNEEEAKKNSSEPKKVDEQKCSSNTTDLLSLPSRRKSLEMEREVVDTERKRSKSFHDVTGEEFFKFKQEEKVKIRNSSDKTRDKNETSSNQTEESAKENTESGKMRDESKKEKKPEKRIRNKDRPSLEIYRPGMGKFSKQRLSEKKEDWNNTSTSSNKSLSFVNKSGKKAITKTDLSDKGKSEEIKNNVENGKPTFTTSSGKEN